MGVIGQYEAGGMGAKRHRYVNNAMVWGLRKGSKCVMGRMGGDERDMQ